MKIDESVIDKVLDNKAAPGEARKVAGWFVTEEGSKYLSGRLDREMEELAEEMPEEEPSSAALFAQLKFYRNYLASKKGVPVNRIFTDDTLSEMARKRPETKEELRAIRGIGPKKSAEYGDAFINIIKSSPQSAE